MFNGAYWEMWLRYFKGIIFPSIPDTVIMLSCTMFFAFILGFALAVVLIITRPDGLKPNSKVYRFLDFVVNTIRSFPIIILIVAVAPLTRKLIGTSIGTKAAIFPLTIAATPFVGRILENALAEVDKQLIEAARSFGASDAQIIRMMVREAIPSIVSGTTLATINYLSCTAMAGAVGAGGLGAVALNYGYQAFNNTILYTSVFILLIMTLLLQGLGNWLYKRL